MTRDDIIRMAQQAGFQRDMFGRGIWDSEDFNRFAALVAAAEREACAKIADNWAKYGIPACASTAVEIRRRDFL